MILEQLGENRAFRKANCMVGKKLERKSPVRRLHQSASKTEVRPGEES